jgi:hypothetical protein
MRNTERLDDGHSSTIMFSDDPTIRLFEKEVTPPAFQSGGPIDTTTMRNIRYRTNSPKKLITNGQMSSTVAYATESYPRIQTMLGRNQLVTVLFPDGAHIMFWGWLDSFAPGALAEGAQPTAAVVVQPSNHDDDGNEVAPVYVPPATSNS